MYINHPSGAVFSAGQFHGDFWQTFLDSFGSLHVLARGRAWNTDDNGNMLNKSSRDGVAFTLYPDTNSLRGLVGERAAVNRQVAAQVAQSDGVIIRTMSEIGWMAFVAARRLNKPVAVEMAGCPWDNTWHHGSWRARLFAPVRYARARYAVRSASHVLYVTERFLQKRYPARGVTAAVSNVRLGDAPPDLTARRAARIENAPPGQARIGLIGAVNHALKGHDTAIAAMEILARAGINGVTLHCLGPGPAGTVQEKANAAGLADKIFFEGALPTGDNVLQWLDTMDIYIQPSRHEGLPRALIEAMSRGCPAIGSDAGGIPELLPPEWIFKKGDAQSLAARVMRLLPDKDLQRRASMANMETARRFHASLLSPRRRAFWDDFARLVTRHANTTV